MVLDLIGDGITDVGVVTVERAIKVDDAGGDDMIDGVIMLIVSD